MASVFMVEQNKAGHLMVAGTRREGREVQLVPPKPFRREATLFVSRGPLTSGLIMSLSKGCLTWTACTCPSGFLENWGQEKAAGGSPPPRIWGSELIVTLDEKNLK